MHFYNIFVACGNAIYRLLKYYTFSNLAIMNPIGQIGGTSERYPSREYDKEEVDLPLFDWQTIVQATNYFSSDNKLGAGGFGPVYKVNVYSWLLLPEVGHKCFEV